MSPPPPSGFPLLLDRLRGLVGPEHVSPTGPHVRVRPGNAAEVTGVLKAAAVGGVKVSVQDADAALVHLDLGRLDQLLLVSATSLLCEAQAGLRLCELEHRLRERQLTLGPLPAPALLRSVGAVLAAPRPGEATPALGRLCDRAARVVAVVPQPAESGGACEMGVPVQVAPRRASGPDLRHLLIGGRGRSGVIVAASLVLARAAAETRCAGWMFSSAEAATRRLCAGFFALGGTGPAELQVLSPEVLKQPELPEGQAALLVRAAGPVAAEQVACFAEAHAVPLPDALCQMWLADLPPQPERVAERAALWPTTARALPLHPQALAQAFQQARGPRLICGVHLHGAAICTNESTRPAPAAGLFSRLLAEIDPRTLLC